MDFAHIGYFGFVSFIKTHSIAWLLQHSVSFPYANFSGLVQSVRKNTGLAELKVEIRSYQQL
jgi:hypothetical protein